MDVPSGFERLPILRKSSVAEANFFQASVSIPPFGASESIVMSF